MASTPGVLQVRTQGRIGQSGATVELVILQLSQHAKALGIAFKVKKVIAFVIAHGIEPAAPGGLLEPMANGVFARVPEGRVANVMGQACRLHDHAQVTGFAPLWQAVAQGFSYAHAQ
ncbi:hypothetical protein D9M71_175940 [compost metagenome]